MHRVASVVIEKNGAECNISAFIYVLCEHLADFIDPQLPRARLQFKFLNRGNSSDDNFIAGLPTYPEPCAWGHALLEPWLCEHIETTTLSC